MKTYRVVVCREWTEYGIVVVEAENKDTAIDAAREMLDNEDDSIVWSGDNMDVGQQWVDSCEVILREA